MPPGVGYDKYFRSTSGDFVDNTGTVVADPATRLSISQSVGGDIGKLPLFQAPSPSAPPSTPLDPSAPPTPTPTFTPPTPTAPEVGTNYVASLTADLEAKRKQVEDAYSKQLEEIKTKQAEAKKQQDLFAQLQEDVLDDVEDIQAPFREELEKTERERLKVEENYFANQGLVEELSTLLNQGNEAIKQAQSVSGPAAIMSRRVNRVISDIAARSGVIEATMAARNNQIAQAYNLIDRSVQAVVADKNDQLSYYNALFSFYQDQKDDEGKKLLDLTNEERRFVDAQISLLEGDLKNAEATANYIRELMISPESAAIVAEAGVTLNDSVDIINKKLADYTVRKQKETEHKANKQFIEAAGVTAPFVNRGGEIQRTADGYAFGSAEEFQRMTGLTLDEAGSRGMIVDLNANVLAEKQQVLNLMQSFPDAGIRATDTLSTAESKLNGSRLYRDSVRPPSTGGGASSVSIPGLVNLTNTQIDNISPVVTQFQNADITKNFNTLAEGYSFVAGLSDTTKNPADDQALIYAFAKAMDPGSVVREGEYATVQKYAQSWVKSYGKSVTQAINGTGFLSTEARRNVKNTIAQRYKQAKTSYDNLFSETSRRIDLVGGLPEGSGKQFLNNYSAAYPEPAEIKTSLADSNDQPVESFMGKVANWLFGD